MTALILPTVIESIGADRTAWLLSFDGPNPNKDEAIELTKDQCFWLLDKIKNSGPNFLSKTKETSVHPK